MIDTTFETAEREGSCVSSQVFHAHSCESPPEIPTYMTEVYDWAYVNPAWVRWLDHNLVVKTLLFCNEQRLMRRYLDRIRPGMRIWQVAHVYGDLVTRAAERTGQEGSFHLTDVTPIQIDHARRKLDQLPWARVMHRDAALHREETNLKYDLVCSFMLLHEVPDEWKHAIVDNMLAHLSDDGEALFVDYHRPTVWHPVRWILCGVNRLLEPFANALWQNEIQSYAGHAEAFEWHKETLFGGVYQVVSVKRKNAETSVAGSGESALAGSFSGPHHDVRENICQDPAQKLHSRLRTIFKHCCRSSRSTRQMAFRWQSPSA